MGPCGLEHGPGLGHALATDLAGGVVEPPRRARVVDDQPELPLGRSSFGAGPPVGGVGVSGFRCHVTSINMGCDSMIPMSLTETVQADLTAAMKAGDDVKKTTLRAVLTAIRTAEAAEGTTGALDDEAVQKLIATEVKQRTEAAEIFTEAGEADRAATELAERDVLQSYLPEPLDADALEALVATVIADGGYTTKKDMGAAIKDVMAKAGGRADGRTVSAAVGAALAQSE